ncbi:hypothetical protein SEA_PLATTE_62 [Microbacterium phage Platte]|nr:hypothetical protein SEA_HORTUS1_62 [Microbacterium phage Hortus1]AWY05633.1 hypothetical protein SEA_OLINDD_62 [Microbacterium phage OlinDD]QZD97655.1 hypothetical protein SEA_PLATTE_62 [Microbacterium phage Platte]
MSEFKFEIGDVVRVRADHGYRAGARMTISDRGIQPNGTIWYTDGDEVPGKGQPGVWEHALTLIERAPIGDPDDSKPEATDITPAYYAFPGGIRVHQISGHLTSFGGQALQYIARSTRLDGQNKGDTAENLRKAIRFLTLEIQRIEAEDE